MTLESNEHAKKSNIPKTCLNIFDPLKPHFHVVKLVFTGEYIIFLISAHNIACGDSFERVPTIYVLSRNMKNIGIFYLNFFVFFGGKLFSVFEKGMFS